MDEGIRDGVRGAEEVRRRGRSLEKGRPCASTTLVNRLNKNESNLKLIRAFCIAPKEGRREEGCRKASDAERQIPEIHLEYLFTVDEEEGKTLGILGGTRTSDESCAQRTVVPRKSSGEWICRRSMAWGG